MATKHQKQTIFLFPWLGHGHISPFFELAKKLSTRNFHIYFCSTPINLKSVKEVSINNPCFGSIEFINLNLPESPDLPPHFHTTKGLPPNLMSPLKTAFDLAQPELLRILKTLKPDLLIYDFMQPWAPQTAKELNINAVLFLTGGAGTTGFLTNFCQDPTRGFPFPEFQFPEEECQTTMQFLEEVSNGVSSKYRYMTCLERSSDIVLIKTSRTVEGKYMDHVSCITRKEMVPVGPLVQEPAHREGDDMIMDWLVNRTPNSVVFASFGTEYFLSKEQLEEVAHGLEMSQVDFIWVLRFHGKDETIADDALPEGFRKRVAGRGLIVEKWAPQAKILEHVSVGGFVSHCGWSSAIEGMSFGVPIIAISMQLDQPFNARVVVGVGVGKAVVRDSDGKFKRDEIAKTIREVVVEEKGEELRRKAKEMRKMIKEKGDGEMDAVSEKLSDLIKAGCVQHMKFHQTLISSHHKHVSVMHKESNFM